MACFCSNMESRALVINANRAPFYISKNAYNVAVLLCAFFTLITCQQCPTHEKPNQLEMGTWAHVDSNHSDVSNGHVDSELGRRNYLHEQSLENICTPSNSFCFPVSLTDFLSDEVNTEIDATDENGFSTEDVSTGFKQVRSNLSWSSDHVIFRFLGESAVSCSFKQRDGFHELPSNDIYTRSAQQTAAASSCIRPSFTHILNSGENAEFVNFGLMDHPVEINPSLLDWGLTLAFLTVKNIDAANVLSVYDPYSSNTQFYLCNFSESLLAPGEEATICFVFFPTQLGLSLAQLVVKTSFGGFLIQAKAFAVESPYLINSGLDVSSSGSWRKNLSLFNPFNEALYVDEEVATIQADEFVLKNWKSHANTRFLSVLDDHELLFPVVHVGNHCYQWFSVKNPSKEPVVVQFILNSWEVIEKCRTPEFELEPPSDTILLGNRSIAPKRYGFSLAQNAITEAFVHPYGSASLGPIFFQPSKLCEWRSSALIRNNLSGVEWLSLHGIGGSRSLVLLEGSKPVKSLEFKLDFPIHLNFSSPGMLNHMEVENSLCHQSLRKDVYAKNVGDLPLEVIRVKVSGAECSLDGFQVHNCKGFSLQPGESIRLQILYRTDFSSSTIHRDLELALATGDLVIPMKTSLSSSVLCFCRRYMFWMLVKKAMVVVLFASLLFMPVFLLFTSVTSFTYQDSKSRIKSSIVNCVEKSVEQEEALVLESAEKLRRRKKKKSSATRLFEISSSQSGNSTPSPPLSPVACGTPKPSCLVSPDRGPSLENTIPIAQEPDEERDIIKCSEPATQVSSNLSNDKWGYSAQETPSVTREVACKAVPFPSATVPRTPGVSPLWECHSPDLIPTSTLAPRARAPGCKVRSKRAGEVEEKARVDEKGRVEDKLMYNLWADNLLGPHLIFQPRKVSSEPPRAIDDNFESFFVTGPSTLFANHMPNFPSGDNK